MSGGAAGMGRMGHGAAISGKKVSDLFPVKHGRGRDKQKRHPRNSHYAANKLPVMTSVSDVLRKK